MGRRSKAPVTIDRTAPKTEVAPGDGLPLFRNHIDIHFSRGGGNNKSEVTRIFFTSPTSAEIADTEALKRLLGQTLMVIGARMPYMYGSGHASPALYEFCLSKDFSEDFSKNLVRLFIFALQGRSYSNSSASCLLSNYQKLIGFLGDYVQQPSLTELSHIDKEFWLPTGYRKVCCKRIPYTHPRRGCAHKYYFAEQDAEGFCWSLQHPFRRSH